MGGRGVCGGVRGGGGRGVVSSSPSLKFNKWPRLLVSNQRGCERQGRLSIKNLIAEMLREENPDWTLKDPQPLINIHLSRHGDAAGDQIKEHMAITTA